MFHRNVIIKMHMLRRFYLFAIAFYDDCVANILWDSLRYLYSWYLKRNKVMISAHPAR